MSYQAKAIQCPQVVWVQLEGRGEVFSGHLKAVHCTLCVANLWRGTADDVHVHMIQIGTN